MTRGCIQWAEFPMGGSGDAGVDCLASVVRSAWALAIIEVDYTSDEDAVRHFSAFLHGQGPPTTQAVTGKQRRL